MLDYPVLKNNAHLMGKMFTCLAHASAGIPLIESSQSQSSASSSATAQGYALLLLTL